MPGMPFRNQSLGSYCLGLIWSQLLHRSPTQQAVAATLEVGMRALGWALTPPRLPFAEGLEAPSDDAVLLEAARRYDARSPGKVLPHDGPSSSDDAPSLAEEQGEVESVSDYVPDEEDFIVERADATAYEEGESGTYVLLMC